MRKYRSGYKITAVLKITYCLFYAGFKCMELLITSLLCNVLFLGHTASIMKSLKYIEIILDSMKTISLVTFIYGLSTPSFFIFQKLPFGYFISKQYYFKHGKMNNVLVIYYCAVPENILTHPKKGHWKF